MARLTSKDVSATKQRNGSWEVAAIVDNHRKSKVYYGYSKREAISEFVREVNKGSKNIVSDDARDAAAGRTRRAQDDATIARAAATVQRQPHPFGHPSILRGGARGPEGTPESDTSYRFTLYINTDNDAFAHGHRANEVARILSRVAHDLVTGNDDFSMFRTLRDSNGNDVGRAKFERQEGRLRPGQPDPRD
jgi:hypothetical protein